MFNKLFNKVPKSNQEVMERLFPELKKYPINTLIPLVTKHNNVNNPVAVSFLYIGDEDILKEFRAEKEAGEVDVQITFGIEKNENKIGKDLTISFEFLFDTGQPVFKTSIPADNPLVQDEFIKALYSVDKFYLFIADAKRKLVKVKEISWDVNDCKDILEQFPRNPLSN